MPHAAESAPDITTMGSASVGRKSLSLAPVQEISASGDTNHDIMVTAAAHFRQVLEHQEP